MKYGIRVRDIMAKRLVTVKPSTCLIPAAKFMRKNSVGALGVVNNGQLVGIVTDGDIIKKVIAVGKIPARVKISEIMTQNPICVSPDDDLYTASKLMNEKGIKRVFVKENGKLIGYLSERDLLKVQPGIMDVLLEKLRILQPSYRLNYKER